MAWDVTERFKRTAVQSHEVASTCVATTPDGTTLTLPIATGQGQVQVDRSQQIRRTAPSLAVQGDSSIFALVSVPGVQFTIQHGFVYGGSDQELIPMITGELSSAARIYGDGLITLSIADRWQKLAGCDRLFPYTPATTARRTDEIIAAVQGVFPGITVRNTASDTGTVGTAQAWTSRADQVASYALDGGMEVYFAPDGALVLRDVPTIADSPAWLIKTGPGGSLEALTRTRPLDKLYNTVVLKPATADPAQTWSQVIAQITDPADPRHPDRIAIRPYPYSAPTVLTLAAAQSVAAQILNRITGTTETLALTALAFPALEAGDVVRLQIPSDSGDLIVNHFLQQVTIDLTSGDMTANTRSNTELAA
jgi:hypothetical protein